MLNIRSVLTVFIIAVFAANLIHAGAGCLVQKISTSILLKESYDPDTGKLALYAKLTYIDPNSGLDKPLAQKKLIFTVNYTTSKGDKRSDTFTAMTDSKGKASALFLISDAAEHESTVVFEGDDIFRESKGTLSGAKSAPQSFETNLPQGINLTTCMPLLLLLGFLGAAMYASGMNPFGMVDFTAPRGFTMQRRLRKAFQAGWFASIAQAAGGVITSIGHAMISAKGIGKEKEKEKKEKAEEKKSKQAAVKKKPMPVSKRVRMAGRRMKKAVKSERTKQNVQPKKPLGTRATIAPTQESEKAIKTIALTFMGAIGTGVSLIGCLTSALGGNIWAMSGASIKKMDTIDRYGRVKKRYVFVTSASFAQIRKAFKKAAIKMIADEHSFKQIARIAQQSSQMLNDNAKKSGDLKGELEKEKKKLEEKKKSAKKDMKAIEQGISRREDKISQLNKEMAKAPENKRKKLREQIKVLSEEVKLLKERLHVFEEHIDHIDSQLDRIPGLAKMLGDASDKMKKAGKVLENDEKRLKEASQQIFDEFGKEMGLKNASEVKGQKVEQYIKKLRSSGQTDKAERLEKLLENYSETAMDIVATVEAARMFINKDFNKMARDGGDTLDRSSFLANENYDSMTVYKGRIHNAAEKYHYATSELDSEIKRIDKEEIKDVRTTGKIASDAADAGIGMLSAIDEGSSELAERLVKARDEIDKHANDPEHVKTKLNEIHTIIDEEIPQLVRRYNEEHGIHIEGEGREYISHIVSDESFANAGKERDKYNNAYVTRIVRNAYEKRGEKIDEFAKSIGLNPRTDDYVAAAEIKHSPDMIVKRIYDEKGKKLREKLVEKLKVEEDEVGRIVEEGIKNNDKKVLHALRDVLSSSDGRDLVASLKKDAYKQAFPEAREVFNKPKPNVVESPSYDYIAGKLRREIGDIMDIMPPEGVVNTVKEKKIATDKEIEDALSELEGYKLVSDAITYPFTDAKYAKLFR